jgi:hypothetical protein
VLRAVLRDFFEPEPWFEDDQTVATFGSTTGMKGGAFRAWRVYIEDLDTRFMTLNGMEQGPAHELLEADTVVVAFEQS